VNHQVQDAERVGVGRIERAMGVVLVMALTRMSLSSHNTSIAGLIGVAAELAGK
jgi:hypothetical protein